MRVKRILILCFIVTTLVAAPKAFQPLGNELEVFQQDCDTYQNSVFINDKLKKACNLFNTNLNIVFDIGYSNSDTKKYLQLLRNQDKEKRRLKHLVYSMRKDAIKNDNIEVFKVLISGTDISINSNEYDYMKKYEKYFLTNSSFIDYQNKLSNENLQIKESIKQQELLLAKNEKREYRKRELQRLERINKREINLNLNRYIQTKSIDFLVKGCNLGYSLCWTLGTLTLDLNPSLSKAAFERGCDAGEAVPCRSLVTIYMNHYSSEKVREYLQLAEEYTPPSPYKLAENGDTIIYEGKHLKPVRAKKK